MEALAFGGPMGLSWGDVDNRATFSVFAFTNANNVNPRRAAARVDNIDALHLDVLAEFGGSLSGGPFFFRVQAVGGNYVSPLSAPMGPYWYIQHSDELADDPAGSYAIFTNPEIPVLVLDARRVHEREAQGHIVGDVHVLWPNAGAAAEDGATHAGFKDAVLVAWQNFIDTELTAAQRGNLDRRLGYRDIHIFVY